MKIFAMIAFVTIYSSSYSQNSFEFLSSSKSSLESVISNYSSSIPDSSKVFKKYYLPLARAYNHAKSSYNAYRGSLKDCILNNNSKKKIQNCLSLKSINIKSDLDSLESVVEAAYLEQYSLNPNKSPNPTYSGHNSGLITGDFIKAILDSLLSGAFKLWDQMQKNRKQFKDDYLNNINSKDYDLSEIDNLLKKKNSVQPAK